MLRRRPILAYAVLPILALTRISAAQWGMESVFAGPTVTRLDSAAVIRMWNDAAAAISRADKTDLRRYIASSFRDDALLTTLLQLRSTRPLKPLRVELGPGYAHIILPGRQREAFIVMEDGVPVLTERWDAFTAAWATRESDHFIFRYFPDKETIDIGTASPSDEDIDFLERHREWLVNLLGVDPPGKLTIYLLNSSDEMRHLFSHVDMRGFIHAPTGAIVCLFPHGVFQQVTAFMLLQAMHRPLAALEQDSARYWIRAVSMYGDGEQGYIRGVSVLQVVRPMLGVQPHPSLRDAISNPRDPTTVAYGAALVRYLVEEYGRRQFRVLLGHVRSDETIISEVERTYGIPVGTLEHDLAAWISHYALPPADPSDRITFRMITDTWDVQRIGPCRVHVDHGMPFPSMTTLGRVMELYRERTGVHPLSEPDIYLALSPQRLRELGVTGSAYIGARTLVSTDLGQLEMALSVTANGR